MTRRRCVPVLTLTLVTLLVSLAGQWGRALAQVAHRDREATITGPRGRTIDRRLEVERGPGMYQRQLQIQRPGGTVQRNFTMEHAPRVAGEFGGYHGRPGAIIERNILVAPGHASSWSFGLMGAPMLTLPFWGAPLPPPVVVSAPPVVMAPQLGAFPSRPPQIAGAQPPPLDPVALAAQRLQSHHASSRRDGAQELGRLGDPRAVPALVYALKYDSSKEVKIAAATALGQIGGQEAEVVLERCIIYEKKEEVREAAGAALGHLRRHRTSGPAPAPGSDAPMAEGDTASVPRLNPPTPSRNQRSPFRPRPRTEEPSLEGPATEGGGSDTERIPPPPPTPVVPPS